MNRDDTAPLELNALPAPVRSALLAAIDGAEVRLTRDGAEAGVITGRPAVLHGSVVLPDQPPPDLPRDRAEPLPEGVTVVATAMRLSDAARARLSQQFGPDYLVLDLHDAPASADVLLVNPISVQLLHQLRATFPQARIVVSEIDDPELGVSYDGPVSRMLDAGATAYLPPRSVEQLAPSVQRVLRHSADPALEAGSSRGLAAPSEDDR